MGDNDRSLERIDFFEVSMGMSFGRFVSRPLHNTSCFKWEEGEESLT